MFGIEKYGGWFFVWYINDFGLFLECMNIIYVIWIDEVDMDLIVE